LVLVVTHDSESVTPQRQPGVLISLRLPRSSREYPLRHSGSGGIACSPYQLWAEGELEGSEAMQQLLVLAGVK
jgi:hypothetical protein